MSTKTNVEISKYKYYRTTRIVTYADGTRKSKQFYGTSKGDAEKKYKEFVEEQARLRYEKQRELDISTLHDRAAEFIETSLRPSAKYAAGTKIRYESSYNVHIKDTWIDRMVVHELRPSDAQRFYNELDVSMSTLKSINKFMSALFKWIARNEYGTDIIAVIDLPVKQDTRRKEDIEVWEDEPWDRLTSEKFDFRHDFLLKLMSYSGMRIGECLGLKYSDIYDDTIHVRRQWNEGEIKPPKYDSRRDIPLHPKLTAALEEHKAWHEAEMKENGYRTDFIFTTSTGALQEYKNVSRSFDRLYKRIGIERHSFHAYRATFCTKLCEAGVQLEVASKLLGHKNLQVTAKHYALIRQDTKRDAIALLR